MTPTPKEVEWALKGPYAYRFEAVLAAEVRRLREEIRQARRAWLGDDYGHLPLIDAMEKYRNDTDARVEKLKSDLAADRETNETEAAIDAEEKQKLRARVAKLEAQVQLDEKAKRAMAEWGIKEKRDLEARIAELESGR